MASKLNLSTECSCTHAEEKGIHTHLDITRILTCVWLWNVPPVCTFSTFSPVTVALLKDFIWSLNSLAEQWAPLCTFSDCMKGRWLAACPLHLLLGWKLPWWQHTPCPSSIWHHISKEQLKVSSMSCTLELTFTGTVPSWHLPDRSLCMGMNSAAWVGSSPVKYLTVGGVRGNMFREEIYDICMTLITQTSAQDSF